MATPSELKDEGNGYFNAGRFREVRGAALGMGMEGVQFVWAGGGGPVPTLFGPSRS